MIKVLERQSRRIERARPEVERHSEAVRRVTAKSAAALQRDASVSPHPGAACGCGVVRIEGRVASNFDRVRGVDDDVAGGVALAGAVSGEVAVQAYGAGNRRSIADNDRVAGAASRDVIEGHIIRRFDDEGAERVVGPDVVVSGDVSLAGCDRECFGGRRVLCVNGVAEADVTVVGLRGGSNGFDCEVFGDCQRTVEVDQAVVGIDRCHAERDGIGVDVDTGHRGRRDVAGECCRATASELVEAGCFDRRAGCDVVRAGDRDRAEFLIQSAADGACQRDVTGAGEQT